MPVASKTATACIGWDMQGIRLAVFTQDLEGYVKESQWNGTEWVGGGPESRLFLAKAHTPLAAVVSLGPTELEKPHFSLFWVDEGFHLREHCFDGRHWYIGPLGQLNIRVNPQSQLAACISGKHQRVYFQDDSGITQECRKDEETWTMGEPVPQQAKDGTPLAACYIQGAPRIFYVMNDNCIRELDYQKDKWVQGSFDYPGSQETCGLAAMTTGEETMILYLQSPHGEIVESFFNGIYWNLPQSIKAQGMLGTTLSACTTVELANPNFKRVYFLKEQHVVVEACNDGREWYRGEWFRGAGAPRNR